MIDDVRRRARAPRPPRPDATNGRTDFPSALARRGCANYEGWQRQARGRGARVGGAPCAVVERQDLRVLRISLQNFLNFFSLTLEDYFCNFLTYYFIKTILKILKKNAITRTSSSGGKTQFALWMTVAAGGGRSSRACKSE